MDIYAGLQDLGFTEYEARTYVGLLEAPGSSGYEISQRSGVPRSRIYEVLQSLVRKGSATATKVDGKLTYHPLDHALLLRRCQEQITSVITRLKTQLTQVAQAQPTDRITTLSGYEQLIQSTRELCQDAEYRLLVGGHAPELELLGPDLAEAERRGVKVFVLSYGDCQLPISHVYEHSVTPLQNLQAAVAGRFLGAVADYREALIMVAPSREQQATGVSGGNLGLVQALTLWLQHDIQVMEFTRFLDPEQMAQVPPEVSRRLLDMITLEPGELGTTYSSQGLPPAASLLDDVQRRIQANPLTYQPAQGVYQFDLSGAGGGKWYLSIHASGCDLLEQDQDSDLTVSMQANDFCALVVGILPAIALLERDRVKITGDLERSAQLQLILRG